MILRFLLLTLFVLGINNLSAQTSLEAQNKILKQFNHLIPKSASFASWTLYEGDINGDKKKDYIFSYILSNKKNRSSHAGSGVILVTKGKANKFTLLGHIPSKNKNIYAFNAFSKNILHLNEYDATSNYQKVSREIKFKMQAGKFVKL